MQIRLQAFLWEAEFRNNEQISSSREPRRNFHDIKDRTSVF